MLNLKITMLTLSKFRTVENNWNNVFLLLRHVLLYFDLSGIIPKLFQYPFILIFRIIWQMFLFGLKRTKSHESLPF